MTTNISGSVAISSLPDVNVGSIVEVQTIDRPHHEIHDGHHYTYADYDSSVDIAAPKYWKFIAPNTATRVHFVFSCSCGPSGGVWSLYEAPTVTVAGTAQTPMNNDRNSANAATTTVTVDPTVTVDGTLLWATYIGSSGGSMRVGGESQSRVEFILDQGVTYVIKFAPVANTTPAAIVATWYEE